jgi:hypothetical protein
VVALVALPPAAAEESRAPPPKPTRALIGNVIEPPPGRGTVTNAPAVDDDDDDAAATAGADEADTATSVGFAVVELPFLLLTNGVADADNPLNAPLALGDGTPGGAVGAAEAEFPTGRKIGAGGPPMRIAGVAAEPTGDTAGFALPVGLAVAAAGADAATIEVVLRRRCSAKVSAIGWLELVPLGSPIPLPPPPSAVAAATSTWMWCGRSECWADRVARTAPWVSDV